MMKMRYRDVDTDFCIWIVKYQKTSKRLNPYYCKMEV